MDISRIINMVFTKYLISLFILSGVVLSFIYPTLSSGKKLPTEYKIGKYVGYIYIGFGFIMFIVSGILG